MKKWIFLAVVWGVGLILATMLGGCSSASFERAQEQHFSAQAEIQKAHAAQSATPLLSLVMGDDGRLKSLTVGRQDTAPTYAPAPVDPALAVWGKAVDGVMMVGGVLAGGNAARGIVKASMQGAGEIARMIQAPPAAIVAPVVVPPANVTTTTTAATGAVIGNGQTLSGTGAQGTGAVYTESPVSNSNNPTDNHSAVSTPTVVQQAAPVVVPTTIVKPEIVTQPAPIIVK
jgi:hypothetical protein